MEKIVLIACANKKLLKETMAKDLYISPLFKYNFVYAKSLKPEKIFILSAKHGLLRLNKRIKPYNKTLNEMSVKDIKNWSEKIISKLKKITNLNKDEFIFLAGQRYYKYLIPYIKNYKIPLKGLGIGKQLKYLKEKTSINERCKKLHQWFNKLKRLKFPFNDNDIPLNGIYILFQKDEIGHNKDRIVRIGAHTGMNQLRSRLKQHFIKENKDRSIFRKNIGRCILNKNNDKFLEKWELDLTTKANKEKYSKLIDFNKQREIEKKITEYIQNNFSFIVIPIKDKKKRLELESKIISTISACSECCSSKNWFGLFSPIKKIRESNLWLVNELYKEPLSDRDMINLKKLIDF